jgi:hypothetical protein
VEWSGVEWSGVECRGELDDLRTGGHWRPFLRKSRAVVLSLDELERSR